MYFLRNRPVLFPGRSLLEPTKPGFSFLCFFVFILCYSIFCYICMFALVVLDLVFRYQAKRLAGKKLPILAVAFV